ncbi:DUF7832 domain-containing protein [Paenibacillus alvei]
MSCFKFQRKKSNIFDKAKWHYEGEFSQKLSTAQAYVPTGMFVAWLIKNDLVGRQNRKGMLGILSLSNEMK